MATNFTDEELLALYEKQNRQKRAKGTKTLGIVVLAGVAVFGLLAAVGSQLPSDERWSYMEAAGF
jgi:hypothetical protein